MTPDFYNSQIHKEENVRIEDSRQELKKTVEEISACVGRDLLSKPRMISRFGSAEIILDLCREYLSSFATLFDADIYSAFAKRCEEELFPNLFSMIRTEETVPGTLERVKSTKGPVIFLPNHDSNLDAMTHGIFFYVNQIPHPKITAGLNLCKDAGGSVDRTVLNHLKGLNALVVDRKLLARDLIYLKVFKEYFTKTLNNGENHCFYIESGRSYGGEIKLGTTSAMLNWSLDAKVDELLVVPMGVSYTRVYEDRELVRCHLESARMPETNLLEEFAKGARILGQDSPIYITAGPTVSFVRSDGENAGRLVPDAASKTLMDEASREFKNLCTGCVSDSEPNEKTNAGWTHKLHDFAYWSMLKQRKILPHYIVSKILREETKTLVSLDSVRGNCAALLARLEEIGANLLVPDTEQCVTEGLANLEKFGAVVVVSGKSVKIDSPGLCGFYGNKAIHPSI